MTPDKPSASEARECPFCNSAIRHIESLAKSFNPPRVYHEWHHVEDNPDCYTQQLYGKIVASATDDPEEQERALRMWNTRASPAPQGGERELLKKLERCLTKGSLTDNERIFDALIVSLKATHDLQATLRIMKSANKKGANMNIWDSDIKAVEDAIAVIEALRNHPALRQPTAPGGEVRREDVAACLSQLKLERFAIDDDDSNNQEIGISIVGHSRAVDKIMALIAFRSPPPSDEQLKIKEALILCEDVLSRAPFSTQILPNGMHPQVLIEKIRNAIESFK